MDLRDYDAIDRLGAALFERYQRLDILVGNAGPARHPHPIAQVKPAEWAEVLDVNVTANWRLIAAWTRCCAPPTRAAPCS